MLKKRSSTLRPTERIVAALDVGSHKVCCLIVAVDDAQADAAPSAPRLRLLGLGLQASQGIAAGAVVDAGPARAAVAAAIAQAEQGAGLEIGEVYVGLAAGSPHSRTFSGAVALPRGVVDDSDIARLNSGAMAYASSGTDLLVSLNRVSFSLDGTLGIATPLGLSGRQLEASHHAVLAAPGPIENLQRLVESCRLEVEEIVPAGYASALAATTREEQRLGVVAVDIGAGVTTVAAFADERLVYTAALPFGGQHITHDIARALGLPLAEAERIKTLYGSVAVSASDEHEALVLESGYGHEPGRASATRGQLCRLVAGRTEWILAGIRSGLEQSMSERVAGAPIVMTGGSAEILGLEALAASIFDRPVRVAALPGMAGASGKFPGGVPSPAFSCVLGLASHAAGPSPWLVGDPVTARTGYFGKVEQWLRESF